MTRTRKLVLWTAVAALMLGGSAAVLPSLVSEGHADHASAVSLKETHDYQNPALLKKAWALPVAATYQAGIEFQRNGSVCGPTSLANVLHSIKQPGDQESILQGTNFSTVLGYLPEGLTLDQLADIARQKLQRKVTVLRDLDLAAFREQLRHVNDPTRRYVINFSRGPLFGTGGGHHSPIAGYLEQEDLVLILDVNKKYGPWLVKPERLYEAMNTIDTTAHKKRGLLLIE
ncbi:MAG TPA: phytochelatin synthase family protein [Steroidobacteraceae bacterium]|nr:phytochelatin synthase family protein [Steroidobacteraceae bacterium]